jgi:hypothetical protein
MPSGEIPDDLRDFIVAHIDSIAHLEALLLLKGNAGRDWTVEACAGRLYISQDEAANVLATLTERGFFSGSGSGCRFNDDSEWAGMVSQLADLYRKRLIPITNLIHSKQNRIQEFADAFKLRKGS